MESRTARPWTVSVPIIVGDQVVLTASSGYTQDRLHVLELRFRHGSVALGAAVPGDRADRVSQQNVRGDADAGE